MKFEKIYLTIFFIVSLLVISYGSFVDYSSFDRALTVSDYIGLSLTFISGITGVICVVLVAKENIFNYLFGIISVTLWLIYIVFWSPLMWDMCIQFAYLILNFYGLYYWLHPAKIQQSGEKHHVALTRRLTAKEWVYYGIGAIIFISILSTIGIKVGHYSYSIQAITDAVSTTIAILAQWFMSKKILENWWLWIALNVVSIPLYLSIGSYTLASVWVVYLINAIYGLIKWHKGYQLEKN